jgi:hypothetical protein
VFVDATPEGDLLGIVGTEGRDWVVGREGRDVYGESLAPEVGDRLQQAYTYRLTIQVDGRTDYAVPPTYDEDRHRYPLIDRTPAEKGTCDITLADGSVRRYSGMRIQRCLPDRKMDINVDLFGLNHEYPTARRPARRAVERRLAGFVLGYLHWLRTEAGMPELGLPVDDYLDNGGFPTVLYVREGRRARGLETFTQGNAAHDSTWPAEHRWSVAIGEYGLDSHCVGAAGRHLRRADLRGGLLVRGPAVQHPVPRHGAGRLRQPVARSGGVGQPRRLLDVAHGAGADEPRQRRRDRRRHRGRTGTPSPKSDIDALQLDLVERDQALVSFRASPPRARVRRRPARRRGSAAASRARTAPR